MTKPTLFHDLDGPHAILVDCLPTTAPARQPMWGITLIDPSGKYGEHKAFFEHGATADDAEESAVGRYRVEGTRVDPQRPTYLAQAGQA